MRLVLVDPKHEVLGRAADGHCVTPAFRRLWVGSVFYKQWDKLCGFSESVGKYHREHDKLRSFTYAVGSSVKRREVTLII